MKVLVNSLLKWSRLPNLLIGNPPRVVVLMLLSTQMSQKRKHINMSWHLLTLLALTMIQLQMRWKAILLHQRAIVQVMKMKIMMMRMQGGNRTAHVYHKVMHLAHQAEYVTLMTPDNSRKLSKEHQLSTHSNTMTSIHPVLMWMMNLLSSTLYQINQMIQIVTQTESIQSEKCPLPIQAWQIRINLIKTQLSKDHANIKKHYNERTTLQPQKRVVGLHSMAARSQDVNTTEDMQEKTNTKDQRDQKLLRTPHLHRKDIQMWIIVKQEVRAKLHIFEQPGLHQQSKIIETGA